MPVVCAQVLAICAQMPAVCAQVLAICAQMPAVCVRTVRHPLTRAASPFTHPAHPCADASDLRSQLAGLRVAPAGCHRVSPGDTVGSGLHDSG